tara:strand:+ start:12408 stop:15140 length:2733 start_codon:yes stop_codon:yes gene_type:complete
MAENKTGIGGLYSSGYGPYMTRTDAQFVRRPAQNFMTGQNLQNPPLDIFDVTMNPDQFFGGSGTGTFNQQFEGSVRRPGLGSGNPNLGDPTFGGGTVPGGGGAGNTGGGGSGGSGGGGGGGGDGGVIIGPGPGGGGGVDLELPVVKGPGTGEQILGLLIGAGLSAAMPTIISKLSSGMGFGDLSTEEQIKINQALNQTGYDMSANLTNIIDSKIDPIIENNIETKFEEDLYDNLEPDDDIFGADDNYTRLDDMTNAAIDSMLQAEEDNLGPTEKVTVYEVDDPTSFTGDLTNLAGDSVEFITGTGAGVDRQGNVYVEEVETTADASQVEEMNQLEDDLKEAGYTDKDILNIQSNDALYQSLLSKAIGVDALDFLIGGDKGKIPVVKDYEIETFVSGGDELDVGTSQDNEDIFSLEESSSDDFMSDENLIMDEAGNFYKKNSLGKLVKITPSIASGITTLGLGDPSNVNEIVKILDPLEFTEAGASNIAGEGTGIFYNDPGMTKAESLISSLGDSSTYTLNEAGNYVSKNTGNVISSAEYNDLVNAEEAVDTFDEGGGIFDFLSKGGGDVAGYKGGLNVGEGISVGLSALQLGKAIKDGDAVGMASGTLGIITTLAGIGGLPGIAIGMAPALMQMALGGPEPYTVGTEATVRDDGYVDIKPVYDGGREIDTVKTLVGSADKVNSIIFQAKLEGIDVGINDEGAKAISDATTFTSMPGGKEKSGVGYVGQQIEELGGSDAVATNALMKAIEVGGVTGDVEAFAEIVNREKPDAFDEGGWGKLNNQIDLINNAVDSGLIPDATRNYGKPDNVVGYRNPDLNNIWDDAGTPDDFSDDELIFAAPFSSQALSQAPGLQNISLGSDEEVDKFNAMIEANRKADDITEVIANLQGAGYDGFADYFVDELDKRNEGSI